jgi:hypothetical protein
MNTSVCIMALVGVRYVQCTCVLMPVYIYARHVSATARLCLLRMSHVSAVTFFHIQQSPNMHVVPTQGGTAY